MIVGFSVCKGRKIVGHRSDNSNVKKVCEEGVSDTVQQTDPFSLVIKENEKLLICKEKENGSMLKDQKKKKKGFVQQLFINKVMGSLIQSRFSRGPQKA